MSRIPYLHIQTVESPILRKYPLCIFFVPNICSFNIAPMFLLPFFPGSEITKNNLVFFCISANQPTEVLLHRNVLDTKKYIL